MSVDVSWFRKKDESLEEYQRRLTRSKVSQELRARFLRTREHELILKVARKLDLVPNWFIFTETDNSALYVAYDFYLSAKAWFQVFLTWNEDGSVEFLFYDSTNHYCCDPNNIEELTENIERALNNPKTYPVSASQ